MLPTIWPALFTPEAVEPVVPAVVGKPVIVLPFELKARLASPPVADWPTT